MAARKQTYSSWFTEEMWLTSEDPHSLGTGMAGLILDGFSGITARKVQLFMVACARRVVHLLPGDLCRRAIDLAETAADAPGGLFAISQLPTFDQIQRELNPQEPPPDMLTIMGLAMAKELTRPEDTGARMRHMIGGWAAGVVAIATNEPGSDAEIGPQVLLLHDIFGNLFRPPALDPAWLTWDAGTIPAIAQGIYEESAFHRLPILADALEDAGCEDADILAHCRGPGPHVRGCWVVDLMLGKK
ncbi:hypothetical protein [Zavarzinella formosa]|uniref:hypothetical protein n=1 Tax=Zavarzinella formosa TaxID=360055 RepID=UPI0004966224|nr:hypothetical protein [Zavarzinella formosa]